MAPRTAAITQTLTKPTPREANVATLMRAAARVGRSLATTSGPAYGGARVLPWRAGMLAPVAWRVPPAHYGPWERVVSILTEGLVARGVDVTLFATADSITRARLVAVAPRGYAEDASLDAKVYESLHIAAAFEHSGA